jgi:hypothetical protein
MLDKAMDFQVRRVVHGTGPDGKSNVLEDSLAVHRVETPAFTIVDLWRINSTSASLENEGRSAGRRGADAATGICGLPDMRHRSRRRVGRPTDERFTRSDRA